MAAGPGIPPIVDKGAMRSGENYPHQVARRLDLHLVDATVSGATTATVLRAPQKTLRGSRPPQIRAVVPEAALVTLTIGGNDLGYIGNLTMGSVVTSGSGLILLPPLRRVVRGRARFGTTAQQAADVTDAMTEVVEQVRAIAAGARVVLVDYLTVVGNDARTCRRLPLTAEERDRVRGTAGALAEAFRVTAQRTGADLVAASAASIDHGVCAAEPWVTGFEMGNPLAGGRLPYHPNLAGMTAVADLVIELLQSG
jgi:lysophospholipase L1-like esterase